MADHKDVNSLLALLGAAIAAAAVTDEGPAGREGQGWLLGWLINAATLAGIAALSLWMWRKAPRGARMQLPARLPS